MLSNAQLAGLVLFILTAITAVISVERSHAQEANEAKPYVFADLPHGRIYKAVHQGCEIFVVESDINIPAGSYGMANGQHAYSITTGRGCH